MRMPCHRYKQISNTVTETGKRSVVMKLRPQSEWIRLPDAPSVISRETFDAVQEQMKQKQHQALHTYLLYELLTCGARSSASLTNYQKQVLFIVLFYKPNIRTARLFENLKIQGTSMILL